MPRPLAPTFRAFAIAVLVALPFAALGACTTEEGATPTCTPDLDSNGVNPVENGCSGFAICKDSKGDDADPVTCCKDVDGKGYTGNELAFCLLSYGVAAPTTATSTTSTSSTGTGSGGAGGSN